MTTSFAPRRSPIDILAAFATDPACLVDDDGTIVAAAGAWAATAGWPAGDIVGRALASLVVPADAEALLVAVRAAAADAVSVVTVSLSSGDGTVFDALVRWVGPGETAVCFRDATQRHLVEQELRRSNQELQRFAYVASHDLSEPLRMVTSYCSLLATGYGELLDAEGREYLAFAVDGAARMKTLIDDLLDYSHVGCSTPRFGRVSLHDVFEEAARDLRPAIEEAGGVVHVGALPDVHGDHGQIARVVTNILANAVKFKAPDRPPVVVIAATSSAGRVTVSVTDNGIGVPAQHRERIFLMFKRLHARDAYPGNGIGLAMCKRILEAHAGEVWVEESAAAGTTFVFTLPVARVAGR